MSFYDEIRKINPALEEAKGFNITRVNIQDVANYYFFGSDKEIFEYKDFPTCVPPWTTTWMEWDSPDHTYSKECGDVKINHKNTYGHVIVNMPLSDGSIIPKNFMDYVETDSNDIFRNTLGILKRDVEGQEAKWMINITTYVSSFMGKFISSRNYFLDPLGNIINLKINENDEKFYSPAVITPLLGEEKIQEIHQASVDIEKVALLALSFCNCKNINIVEDKISRQQKRFTERKGLPTYKTYTLEISAMRKILNSHINNGNGAAKALHLCRGHFKTYTKENPLLGKFEGTYWWDMHQRGDSSFGEVKKDYKVCQPANNVKN